MTTEPVRTSDGRPLTERAWCGTRRFFTKGDGLATTCARCTKAGGREADDFYRDRWSHDKVVRSTHGVNCTGSCSWKVYVKDGIITWETQQTDYPSVGPGHARSTSRAAARAAPRSPGTPTRRPGSATPTSAACCCRCTARPRPSTTATRCRPGRTSSTTRSGPRPTSPPAARAAWSGRRWDEATEMVAAAHVHTIKKWGPDRVAGLLADPGDVDGVARVGRPVHLADRRLDAVVLRLVRRPAGRLARRCSATRPTCRSRATGGTPAT